MSGGLAQLVQVNGVRLAVRQMGKGLPVLLLHGFTGSSDSLLGLMQTLAPYYRVLAVDLLGHGQSDAPEDWERYGVEQTVRDIDVLLEGLAVEKLAVFGYSMGGRIALSFACEFPHRIASLILESASPGLADPNERITRRASDWQLAQRIENHGVRAFVDDWESQALFRNHALKNPALAAVERTIRLGQRPQGLAGSLRGAGTGAQQARWAELERFSEPTLLVTGNQDEKFCGIAKQMAASLPNARHVRLPDCGHTVHLENPEAFDALVLSFLLKVWH